MNRYRYTITPEQMDRSSQATIPSLYKLVIDAVGLNIRKEGFGIDVMEGQGLTWALARCAMVFSSRPSLYDEISIEISEGENQGLCYGRNIRILGDRGDEICHGTTDWCVLDKASRRPLPFPFEHESDENARNCEGTRRLRPFTSLLRRTRQIGYSECDFNGHLNNSRYLEMFYDMLPQNAIDAMKDFRLDINFRREVPCGSLVESYVSDCKIQGYDYCMYYDGAPACCASISAH